MGDTLKGGLQTPEYRNSPVTVARRKPDFGNPSGEALLPHACIQGHRESELFRSVKGVIALAFAGPDAAGQTFYEPSAQRARHAMAAAFVQAVSAHVA